MLKTVYVGKKAGGVAQVEKIALFSGDRVVLIDATTGKPPKKITTKMVNKNLHIFEEGASEPSAILGDYETYQNTVHISGIEGTGQYVDYAQTSSGVMELGGTPMATPPPPSEPLLSMNAIYGIGILAGVGVAVAAAGGGDSTTTTTTTVVDQAPIAAPTIALTSDVGSSTTDGITSVNGVTVSGITQTNWEYSLDGGTTWTTGTAAVAGTSSFNLVANTSYAAGDIQVRQYTDSTNKSSIAANTQTWLVDTTGPTLTITDNEIAAVANIAGGDILYTFTFDEAVKDFNSGDVVVTKGSAGTFTKISDTVYTLAVTPNDGFEGDMTVSAATTAYHDVAGNQGDANSDTVSTQAVDMLAPTYTVITVDSASESIALTFSENLQSIAMSSIANFSFSVNGTQYLNGANILNVGTVDNQVTLTLSGIDITSTDTVLIAYSDTTGDMASAIQDLAGNDATSFSGWVTTTVI